MRTAKVTFKRAIQDSQVYSCFEKNDEHMVSVLEFDVEIGGKSFPDLSVEIRQPCGTDYESEPIEVSRVVGYKGPWHHENFANCCEKYYREFVGASAKGIRVPGGSIRMRNNSFMMQKTFEFEVPSKGGGW